jgi:transposase
MRPHGSPAELEARRRQAVALLDEGLGVREVARQIGCSPASVSRWHAEVRSRGPDALRRKPAPGRPRRLTGRQRARLLMLLRKGPTAHGFSTEFWTLARVATVITRTFGVTYHPAHVWKILRGEHWSYQKPERRARERDEAAILRSRTEQRLHRKTRPPRRQDARLLG